MKISKNAIALGAVKTIEVGASVVATEAAADVLGTAEVIQLGTVSLTAAKNIVKGESTKIDLAAFTGTALTIGGAIVTTLTKSSPILNAIMLTGITLGDIAGVVYATRELKPEEPKEYIIPEEITLKVLNVEK